MPRRITKEAASARGLCPKRVAHHTRAVARQPQSSVTRRLWPRNVDAHETRFAAGLERRQPLHPTPWRPVVETQLERTLLLVGSDLGQLWIERMLWKEVDPFGIGGGHVQ